MNITFQPVNGQHVASIPQGRLVVTRVPRAGLQGIYRPNNGRAQVWVAAGTHRGRIATQNAMIDGLRKFTGLDEIRSFV